jgi:divalent metal cation (Fe/Co/Zn/Cd) transporter
MLWNGRGIALTALRQLLDRELELEQGRRITQALLSCPGVRAMHDLRTRDAGDRIFVEFHLEVDGDLPVSRGHSIADSAERAVRALFPAGAEVTAHLDTARDALSALVVPVSGEAFRSRSRSCAGYISASGS